MLGGRNGLRNTWVFIGGEVFTSLVSGAAVALGIADLGIHVGSIGGGAKFPGIYIGAGALLLVAAAWVLWRSRHPRARRHEHDRHQAEQRLERMAESWKVALGVGLVFGLPSPWFALALAKTSGHGAGYTALTVLVFTVIAYSWGWIPAVWFMFDRARAVRLLTGMRSAVGRHRIAIIVAVLAAVGGYFIAFGVITG